MCGVWTVGEGPSGQRPERLRVSRGGPGVGRKRMSTVTKTPGDSVSEESCRRLRSDRS